MRFAALAGMAVLLGACSTSDETFRQRIGIDQTPPDEFLVVSKAPLTMPPNMSLRPPAPGAPPTNQADPREAARSSVTGTTSRPTATGSSGEQAILARAGASPSDSQVRADLLREQGIEVKEQSIADRIIRARRDEEELLDPLAEQERLRRTPPTQTASVCADGTPVPEGGCPAPAANAGAQPTSLLDRILGGG